MLPSTTKDYQICLPSTVQVAYNHTQQYLNHLLVEQVRRSPPADLIDCLLPDCYNMDNREDQRQSYPPGYPPRSEEQQLRGQSAFQDGTYATSSNVLLPDVSWPFYGLPQDQNLYQNPMPGTALQPSTSFPFSGQMAPYTTSQQQQYLIDQQHCNQIDAFAPDFLPNEPTVSNTVCGTSFAQQADNALYETQIDLMQLCGTQLSASDTLHCPDIMVQDHFGISQPQQLHLRRPVAPRSVSSTLLSSTTSEMWPSDNEGRPSSLPRDIGGSRSDSELSIRQIRQEVIAAKEGNNYKCPAEGCGKLFNRSYNFRAHMETHDENRVYPFKCAVERCDKEFRRKTDLQRHHLSVHVKEREHKCAICQKHFSRKDTLKRHQEDCASKASDSRRSSR